MGNGAPAVIRTPDLLVRSQTLYPAELRARYAIIPYRFSELKDFLPGAFAAILAHFLHTAQRWPFREPHAQNRVTRRYLTAKRVVRRLRPK
jgi:hypothetical protein